MKSRICHIIEKNLHNNLFCYYCKRARHLCHCTLCFEKCFQDHGKTARLGQNLNRKILKNKNKILIKSFRTILYSLSFHMHIIALCLFLAVENCSCLAIYN